MFVQMGPEGLAPGVYHAFLYPPSLADAVSGVLWVRNVLFAAEASPKGLEGRGRNRKRGIDWTTCFLMHVSPPTEALELPSRYWVSVEGPP